MSIKNKLNGITDSMSEDEVLLAIYNDNLYIAGDPKTLSIRLYNSMVQLPELAELVLFVAKTFEEETKKQ